ncbi:MAG: hypothetical protein NUV65_02310 [Candidatus Roizmanbacteria bacterium]|nr:hypothetical protein [Candidatus Roizmanbacteria bacterium]
MHNNKTEILLASTVLALLFLLTDPFMLFMPNTLHMIILVILVLLFGLFSIYIWKEKARDEREELHRNIAGRFAYLAGAAILLVAIVVQSFQHRLDPWLLGALSGMISAKIIGILYSKYAH